ncbi:MAG: hypothetical protein COB15_00255 [Flavobacteriales bacterium]|nr:MAG: hypothetical protein COB15_00255 [Flavobacteriales bacterium]
MRIPIYCRSCLDEGIQTNSIGLKFAHHGVLENGIYESICSHGHSNTTILDAAKFELLFDIGMMAICDGYYRDAVSSFASSLERFYELYINSTLFTKSKSSDKTAELVWKKISNQSERQLGAFILLYTKENKAIPDLLKNDGNKANSTKFRNNVIHKGYIPSLEEALIFGETIHKLLSSYIKTIEKDNEKLRQFVDYYKSILPKNPPTKKCMNSQCKSFSMLRQVGGSRASDFEHIKLQFSNFGNRDDNYKKLRINGSFKNENR